MFKENIMALIMTWSRVSSFPRMRPIKVKDAILAIFFAFKYRYKFLHIHWVLNY